MTLMRIYDKNGLSKRTENPYYRFSDMLNDFWGEDSYNRNYTNPGVNVVEEKEAFKLFLAVPGVSKKDIKIDVEKDTLRISGNTENSDAEVSYNRREFDYSNFERIFRLPDTVNVSAISAGMENGILTLSLPKKEESIDRGPKEIKIS